MLTAEGTTIQTASPVALVTGASSGIGRPAALALVGAGFAVIGTSRNAANTGPLAGVTFLDLDVTSEESVRSLVEEVIERFGRIDVLVNNAGVGAVGAGEESSITQAKEVFEINVFGLIRMTNAVLPHMRAQGSGRVVNVSSVLGLVPAPFMAVYAATKHAVEGYSESVDHELREHGVRMLLVEPAYTSTSFEASSLAPDSPLPIYAPQRDVARDVLDAHRPRRARRCRTSPRAPRPGPDQRPRAGPGQHRTPSGRTPVVPGRASREVSRNCRVGGVVSTRHIPGSARS
jgi:NAD(P)-dependent dehydrogenase (short-subunit alcohol dehydrogenase family)